MRAGVEVFVEVSSRFDVMRSWRWGHEPEMLTQPPYEGVGIRWYLLRRKKISWYPKSGAKE